MKVKAKKPLVRILAPQRSVSLYKDQEDMLAQVVEGNTRLISQLVRKGVDLALKEYIR